jgi:AcrR family transcriptional regulator
VTDGSLAATYASGVPSPTSADAQRAVIVRAAVEVMRRDGLAAATTRRIAAEAGVNHAMIHYFFGTKQDLLRAVIDGVRYRTVQAVQAGVAAPAADGPGRDVGELATDVTAAVWAFVEQRLSSYLFVIELTVHAMRTPDLRHLADQVIGSYQQVAEDAVRSVRTRAPYLARYPVEDMASMIVDVFHGVAFRLIVDGDRERGQRDLRRLLTALLVADSQSVPAPQA